MDTSKTQADQFKFEAKYCGDVLANYSHVSDWGSIEQRTAYAIIDRECPGAFEIPPRDFLC